MSVFLIAQTPRAGLRNHCFVVPDNFLQLTSRREVRELLSTALSQAEGNDYIAVSKTVEQVASSRQGREMLVLVGIDVQQLSESDRKKVRTKLEDYLSQLEILVTETIDWEKSDGDFFVLRSELDKWGQDNFFMDLPPSGSPVKRAKAPPKYSYSVFLKTIGAAILLVIILYTFKQCTKDGQEQTVDKFPYHKYNSFLPELCQVSEENWETLAEFRSLCQISKTIDQSDFLKELRESDCHEFLLKIESVNEETVFEFVTTEENKDKLQAELELDRQSDVVKIRNQLRALYKEFNPDSHKDKVCLPFFTDEDVEMTSSMLPKLAPLDGTLASYLALAPKKVVLKVKRQRLKENLESLITKWELGNPKKAVQELEVLLLKVCDKANIDELVESHCGYETAKELKMSVLVADKRQIYGLLGLELSFDNGEGVVAVRNALRELDAALNGKKVYEPVYLPLFSDEDARIIIRLEERLKKVKLVKSENMLEGLKQLSELAQQLRQRKFKPNIIKQVIEELKNLEYISVPHDITNYVSQQLSEFRSKVHKLDKLTKSIEAVRGR
ncbi:MAG: hypothetical protein ABFS56_05530 [Pseudomonadota bacterium]